MRRWAGAILLALAGCTDPREPTQAGRSTAEELDDYRRRIDEQIRVREATQRGVEGYTRTVWTVEGKIVRESPPPELIPVIPGIPPRAQIDRIEFRNVKDLYWVAETAAEIDRIYRLVVEESKEPRPVATTRYVFPDGSSFEATITPEVYSHACAMGLFFYGKEELVYEISGHPGALWLELRHTREGQIVNPALSELVGDYCRRSPSYVAEHPGH